MERHFTHYILSLRQAYILTGMACPFLPLLLLHIIKGNGHRRLHLPCYPWNALLATSLSILFMVSRISLGEVRNTQRGSNGKQVRCRHLNRQSGHNCHSHHKYNSLQETKEVGMDGTARLHTVLSSPQPVEEEAIMAIEVAEAVMEAEDGDAGSWA